MKKFFYVAGLLACLGFCGGCGPKPAPPEDTEFSGTDLEDSMKAMEDGGAAPGGEDGAPVEEAAPAE